MQFKKHLMTATLLTVGSFAAISSANAASPESPAESSFAVSMEVESLCTVKSAPLAVTLDNTAAGLLTTDVKGSTNLILNCSKGDTAIISLSSASTGNADGTGNLKGGLSEGELVAYKLSSDSAGETAWGTTTTVTTAAATDYATDIETPIYLTTTGSTDVTPGSYIDTINVSVAY